MSEQQVGDSRVLAGRYLVEDLLDEVGGVRAWRAVDEVLSRAVYIQTLPADDPRAGPITEAARAAAQVRDSRFLQVLDVDVERGLAYVVREWTSGRSLTTVLADGPLSADQAGALAHEVAAAMTTAHHDGLTHLLLRPGSIVITPDGRVKIAGLATEAAIHGAHAGDPGGIDATGVGSLLYAALTGRWPGGPGHGLPAAPHIDGRVASPRQVRPGVPRLLDEVADRTLGNAGRHNAVPLRSPAEILDALTTGASTGRVSGLLGGFEDAGTDADRPPAVLDDPMDPAVPPRAAPPARPPEPQQRRSGLARAVGVLVGALLLGGATLLGLELLRSAVDGGDGTAAQTPATAPTTATRPSTPAAAPAEPAPIAIAAATDFDPPPAGSGDENPDDTSLAIDGDTGTAWNTLTYYDPLEVQKPGVGLFVDLGSSVAVSGLNLRLASADADLEIRAAPGTAVEPPRSIDDWTVVAELSDTSETVPVSLEAPVTTRYVLVWFTRLPAEGGDFRGGVAEVEVLG
ncbi:MAG TPA: protein kinase family protein [Jiangellaceae bacterium]|nr:protein kinase family protein [Jiangellaceae bacterium]